MANPFTRLNPNFICLLFLISLFFFSIQTVFAKVVTVIPNPASGVAPLEVKLKCVVTGSVPAQYTIDFGDGSENETVQTNEYSHTFTHTYENGFFRPVCRVKKVSFGSGTDSDPARVVVAKWKFETGDDVDCSPAVGSDGTVYVGSDDHNFYAIHPDTGEEIWRFPTGGEIQSSPAIGPDGTIYVGCQDQKLYALKQNGTLKWALNIGDFIFSSPAISADGNTIYIGSSDNSLYAISRSGTLKWKYTTGNKIVSSPVIGHDGIEETVYFGSLDNHVYALAADNGALKWKFKTDAEVYASPAISSTGQIYIGECRTGDSETYKFKFYSINVDGSLFWQLNGGTGFYSSAAIGPDGLIYVGSWDGVLYAIRPNGKIKWGIQSSPLADINSSPAIASNGVVYAGSKNGNFYAFQAPEIEEDIKEDWVFQTGGDILYSSPVIDKNGTIYFGSRDNHVYAINPGSMDLADSPWPMFQQGINHGGNAKKIIIPSIISSYPLENSIGVEIDTAQIKINFSPDIKASQIFIDSFILYTKNKNDRAFVDGYSFVESNRYNNVAYNVTAVFERINEEEVFDYNTEYFASISYTTDKEEAEGQETEVEPNNFEFSFRTEREPVEESSGSGGDVSCFIETVFCNIH